MHRIESHITQKSSILLVSVHHTETEQMKAQRDIAPLVYDRHQTSL